MTRLDGRTILQVVPALDAGGAEQTTLDIAAAIVAAGGRAPVLARGGRMTGALERTGATFIGFPAETKNPLRMAANAFAMLRIVRRETVDLVHARSRAPAWSALAAARMAAVPFVTTYHGHYGDAPGPKRLYNSVMARGEAVIANSRFTAEHIRITHGTAPERMAVIPRGSDFAVRFNPAEVSPERVRAMRAAWSVAADDRIVLLPGRLTRWKGQGVLIRAACVLKDAMPDLVFVFAGDAQGRDGYASELFDAAQRVGLVDRIRMPGHVDDMPAAYRAASVVVSASTGPEAFGRVAAEAQGMGVPTIVTALGATGETVLAPPDVAAADRTGWRIAPNDVRALAGALVEALDLGPDGRAALARRARAHAVGAFSLKAMTDATLAVYARLLAQPS